MARARTEDPLLTAYFQVFDLPNLPVPNIFPSQLARLGGFSGCTGPQITLQTEELEEGNWPYTRRLGTKALIQEVTLTRGIKPFDIDFVAWMQAFLFGRLVTRRNILIMATRPGNTPGLGGKPILGWLLLNCLPRRVKMSGDMNALASEISIAELDLLPDDILPIPLGS